MVNLGVSIYEIDTPALLIDLDVMEKNIQTMAEAFRGISADLRPHTKTHKTPIIAHKQIAAGAIGVTCAKLGEAEVMVEAGIRSILIANQVVGEPKVTRLVNLAKHSDVIVAVDDPANVRHLAEAARRKDLKLNVLVEVDVGNNRCGVDPGEPALTLAREVSKEASLSLRGLMGYEGFCQFIPRLEDRRAKAEAAMDKLVASRDTLVDAGVDVEIVSGGGTGTHMITGNYPGVTEVEAGSYVFMDAKYSTVEGLEKFGKALTVLSTVLSTPRPGVAVCDAGLKALTTDFGVPVVKGVEGVEYVRANEEHGHLKVEPGASVKAGDKIEIFPTHCCTNTNLYDYFHCVRDGSLEAVWRIAARGRSQ
jgi:3-hydroxy-D-aspartate aldolase